MDKLNWPTWSQLEEHRRKPVDRIWRKYRERTRS